jgi:PAS domain S-box-containing protein
LPFPEKGALMLDLDGRIAFASTYFCDLLRVPHDRIAGMSFVDFLFHEDRNQARNLLRQNHGPNGPLRFRLRRTDGEPVVVDVLGAALYTAGGELYATSVAITPAGSAEAPLAI